MSDRPLIPATEALLDGWEGPFEAPGGRGVLLLGDPGLREPSVWAAGLMTRSVTACPRRLVSLDPARREAAHRVVDVAREVYGVDLSALLDQPAALAEAWRGLVGGAS